MSEKYETIVPSEPDAGERLQWVSWLRSAAPYVHLHHGRTFVISFAGEVVADRTLLNHLVMDVSLIASMGMRVVLVHGSRPQIEELMSLRKLEGQFYKGVRITGPQELECVKEACGETRFDIEAPSLKVFPILRCSILESRWFRGTLSQLAPWASLTGWIICTQALSAKWMLRAFRICSRAETSFL